MLRTIDIPQANDLQKVVATLQAIADGHRALQAIATVLGVAHRHGSYYLHAARILGLVTLHTHNQQATLTVAGTTILHADDEERTRLLRVVLAAREPSVSEDDVGALLQQLAPLGASTARRRAQAVLAWLQAVDLAALVAGCWYDVCRIAARPHRPCGTSMVVGVRHERGTLVKVNNDYE
jgi:predicted acyl esterase